ARALSASQLTQRGYRVHGRYSTTAIKRRFGRWNAAVARVGLNSCCVRHIPDAVLFDNLREVWMKLGRRPRKRDMIRPVSRFTHHPYLRRFGGWLPALRAFVQENGE